MENLTSIYTDVTAMNNSTVLSLNKTLQEYSDEEANRRLAPVIYLGLLMIIGIPGNFLVLIVFLFKFSKSTHRTFILGLAVADMLVCMVALPFEITKIRLQYTFYSQWPCKFFRVCNSVLVLSSIFILMGLSGDRYRRICTPYKLQMTSRHAFIFVISSVILAVLFSWPNIFISGIRLVKLSDTIIGYDCSLSDQFAKTKYPTIYVAVLFLSFIICMVSLIILYLRILCKISTQFSKNKNRMLSKQKNDVFVDNKQDSEKQKHQSTKNSAKEDAASRRLTKITFAISLAFILSYVPYLIINLLAVLKRSALSPSGPVSSAVLPILTRSFAINNIVNPIIYGFMDSRFRDNCKLIFKTRFRRQ